ncbi:MATE family efflux transporter [Terrisporobacter sp.]|uniref:MATE family efflux transporter n=1 Tax=Terrisporobacter sp. TaxID=1965305 RepID=UPI002A83F7B2|nr:MATE family efflux transporter [Terrisporobacter sp.]MDY4735953.1 MATE family efflux transporter [Terrisporobacter sp.]
MNQEQFGTMEPKKLFLKLAIPSLISMLFSSLYMMADGIFVGKIIGSKALAAINLVFPIIMILFAVGDMVASGASVKIGIKLGEKNEKEASEIFSVALLFIFILNIIFAIIGLIFTKDIIFILIKDKELANLAYKFAYVFILFLPIIAPFFAIDNYLRICGKANMSMWINIGVSVLNIILDAIFIGYLKLGIEYAALASSLSMSIGTLILIYPFITKKVVLRFTKPKINIKEMLGIIYNGSSQFFSNVSGSVMSIIMNSFLLHYGGAVGVAAYSIVMYIESLIVPMLFGMIDAVQPVFSYNYGAKNNKRIMTFFKITCTVALSISIVTMIIIFVFPDFLVRMFSSESDIAVIDMAKKALLLYAPSYLFTWFIMTVSGVLTGLEKATESIVLMSAESIILPLFSTLVLTQLIGVYGIFITPTISGAVSIVVSIILWRKCIKSEIENS